MLQADMQSRHESDETQPARSTIIDESNVALRRASSSFRNLGSMWSTLAGNVTP